MVDVYGSSDSEAELYSPTPPAKSARSEVLDGDAYSSDDSQIVVGGGVAEGYASSDDDATAPAVPQSPRKLNDGPHKRGFAAREAARKRKRDEMAVVAVPQSLASGANIFPAAGAQLQSFLQPNDDLDHSLVRMATSAVGDQCEGGKDDGFVDRFLSVGSKPFQSVVAVAQSLQIPERTFLRRLEELSETVVRLSQCGWRAVMQSLIAMKPHVTLSCLHVSVVQDEASRRLRQRERAPEISGAARAVLQDTVNEAEVTKVMATELSLGVQFTIHADGDVADKHVTLHGDYPALLRVVDRTTGEVFLLIEIQTLI